MESITYLDLTGLTLYHSLLSQYITDVMPKILYDTTANWNSKTTLLSEQKTVYIYSDYYHDNNNNPIPGFKIGDGNAYLIDLAFTGKLYDEHLADTVKHITAEERAFWNGKIRCYIDSNNTDKLIFTTN